VNVGDDGENLEIALFEGFDEAGQVAIDDAGELETILSTLVPRE
jgi:hypothetical protein